jgi:hypothetical protein
MPERSPKFFVLEAIRIYAALFILLSFASGSSPIVSPSKLASGY